MEDSSDSNLHILTDIKQLKFLIVGRQKSKSDQS